MGGFMPSPNEKLAESLDVLEALQEGNRRVFRSEDLSRVHRERLVENGFLQEVMKGWLISASPDSEAGESTPCVVLGILRPLLRRTLWRTMAPVAGGVSFFARRENGDPRSTGGAQSESDE
jgi:hypothetical protein